MASDEVTRATNDFQEPSSNSPVDLRPGETILGKFKIIKLLGSGGMGSVYLVDHVFLGKQCALKCLNKQQPNEVVWRRFQNEAKAASKLDHANLIKVHEFDLLPDGRPFILMDYVKGRTLADLIKTSGSLPLERAINIMIQVAFAIQYAHDQGVIHRDLKPTNIMVSDAETTNENESVKVVDFGIAKLTGIDEFNQQTLTKTGEIFGSPLYMSPEQCTGVMVDHRTDLYSMGCVFYEMLTGAPPFIGENALSTMMKHQTETQLSLKEASLGANFPTAIEQIIAKLLEKDPNRRYQNANSVIVDLLPLTQETDQSTSSTLQRIKQNIPILQGQTTQLMPPERASAASKNKSSQILINIIIFILAFASGYATCYFFQESQKSVAPNAPPVPEVKIEAPTSPYLQKVGQQSYFRFPQGIDPLGKLFANTKFFELAQRKVLLPKNKPIGLWVDTFLLLHPQLWEGFGPNDLAVIDFIGNAKADSRSFAHLARFTGLRVLSIGKTAFGPNDLKYLDSLKSLVALTVGYCYNFSARDLVTSKILPQLQMLDMADLKDGHLVMDRISKLPNLRELVADNCSLTDEDLRMISENENLRILSVSCNHNITDKGVAHLTKMKHLQWLVLSSTEVTPNCLTSLLAMPSLKELELGGRKWADTTYSQFVAKLKQAKPKLIFHQADVPPNDTKVSMPDFPWQGPPTDSSELMNDRDVFNDFENRLEIR